MKSAFPTLGILGGGQLARMTAYAAFQLGMHVHVMERFANSPAGSIAHLDVVGDPSNHQLLLEFAEQCDVITLESEFINEAHLAVLERAGHALYPSAQSVALIQDKLIQKQTLAAAGIPVAPFAAVETLDEAADFGEQYGYPFVLKSRRGGYDGYGNATIRSREEIEDGWRRIAGNGGRDELYCEAFIRFTKELAVMVTRGRDGGMAVYPVVETVQQNHICTLVVAPADIEDPAEVLALDYARRAVATINGVGVFGVELFLGANGDVLVNEMAPRPHNSGHYTIEGCATSQFENHIRAVMGWPLGSTALRAGGVAMANILGDADTNGAVANYPAVLRHNAAHLHIYGKQESRRGRKMGHVTALAATPEQALSIAIEAEADVRFGADRTA